MRGATLVEWYGGDEARAALSVVAAASATADVACAFGGAIVRATASATGGSLRCTTPPWHTAGAVSVRVSLNGQQFHELVPPTSDGTPPGDCLLYTSDAADEEDSVDLGGRGMI